MKAFMRLAAVVTMLSVCSVTLAAEFQEDFESYAAGSQMHGQGGWSGWDGAVSAGSPASDAYAYSGDISVEIISSADLVHEFDVSGGQWVFRTMVYIPSGGAGENMFIMLNTYTSGGDPKDWSIQTTFNVGTGAITSAYHSGVTGSIVYDKWVELRLMIDLDNNTVEEYYNDALLFSHSWDDTSNPTIQCVDLYGNSASSIYYDDIVLETLVEYEAAPTEPIPADAATDVARDVVVTWTPGGLAASHDVYFGADYSTVATATRTDPMGVLVSQGQSEAAYDLEGLLEFGQTYYWRIDEIRQDGTIDSGDVWTFTAEPFAYEMQNVLVSTDAQVLLGQGPQNTINGSGLDDNGHHSNDTSDMWLVDFTGDPISIQYEFDRIYQMYEMVVWNHNFIFELALGLGAQDVTVEYSVDGGTWVLLEDVVMGRGNGQATYTANTVVDFAGIPAKYVRLTINSSYGANQVGLSEVRFSYTPAHPRYPVPADGATGVDVASSLSWRPGRDAAMHNVFLGTNPDAPTFGGMTTEPGFIPASLDLATTYYWHIIEVNAAEAIAAWQGPLWSFTTAEYIEIDGFETYTDDSEADQAIWQAWVDGLEDGGNGGSMVGNDPSPFAEQEIVHGGSQSMPLYYSNDSASDFSEADFTLPTAQDWTASKIRTLTLWFRGGQSTNTGQLYIKINNTKVLYNGDASDIGDLQWRPWNIDLQNTGANLSNVATLSIGIEGAGQGLIFIDDIRLSAKTPRYVTPIAPDAMNLVAHYALDGNAGDSSGNGHDGAATGGHLYVNGVTGRAIDFDGSGYVEIANSTDWPSGTAPRTMAAWLLTRSVDTGYRFAVAYGTAAGSQAMFIGINGTTLYGGGYGNDVTMTNFWATGEWSHICLTYDGGTARLYANGVQVSMAAKSWNLALNRARIGQQVNDLSEFWRGSVDDVYIYRAALSAGQVAYLAGKTGVIHLPF